jgi:glutamate-1-semialdehyde aminotransferase
MSEEYEVASIAHSRLAHALERAVAVTPGGSQTTSRRHGLVGPFSYPAFAESASGAYITLDDGDTAIDLAGANATVALGYNHPFVVAAIQKQVSRGGSLSLPSYLEAETSERLVSLLPYPAMVRWVRTGSEAVSAAVAIAQEVTRRKTIATFEGAYHGWHPWTRDTVKLTNEGGGIGNGLAAVIVESPRWTLVDDDYIKYLQRLRTLCDQVGALLIFDDVVYAFRYHSAGLQGRARVRPDLACFSKALGNGIPVGCVAGEPSIMQDANYRVSSTFGGEMIGLAAANAVLTLHQENDVCGDLETIGLKLQRRLQQVLHGTVISLTGTPQHFRFEADSPSTFERFLQLCMGSEEDELRVKEGAERLLVHRDANNISLAMDKDVRKEIVNTVKLAAMQAKDIHV